MILQRRGKNRFDWPVDRLRQMVADGMTHRQIADEFGIDPKSVSPACKKLGIKCQRRGPRSGPGHPNWRGGRRIGKGGYPEVWVGPDHPMVSMVRTRPQSNGAGYGYILEHRLVMALHLGRPLLPEEVVHHKNGIHDDNRLENLELFSSNAEHLAFELAGRCPNWSEDGRKRTLDGLHRRWSIQKSQVQDGPLSSRNTAHQTDEPDGFLQGLS